MIHVLNFIHVQISLKNLLNLKLPISTILKNCSTFCRFIPESLQSVPKLSPFECDINCYQYN